jgi:neopullulanase
VRRFILGVARRWLERGIDGWRLDVPHEINDDSFWREFRRVCKAVNPGCYITGEIWGEARRWLAGDQFDAVMNYQLSAGCISYFGGDKLKLTQPYDGRVLKPIGQAKFIAAMKELLGLYKFSTTLVQMNILSSHDTDRMHDTYGGDTARVKLAAVFSYLFPGAVNLYYGEELGLPGVFNNGTRSAMPWNHKELWNKDLLKFYKALGALRRNDPVIRDGRFEFLKKHCGGGLLTFRRFLPGRGQLVCFMNDGGVEQRTSVPPALAGRAVLTCGGAAMRGAQLALPPWSCVVLRRAGSS